MMAGKPNFDFSYPIIDNSNPIHNDESIANIFANFYQNIFNNQLMIHNSENKEIEVHIASQLIHKVEYNREFNICDLKSVIALLKENSAMGQDTIHNSFFIHLSDAMLENLLKALNKIWKSGNIPQHFKHST